MTTDVGKVAGTDWAKLLGIVERSFVAGFLAALLSGLLPIIESFTNGSHIDLTTTKSLALALVVGAITAGVRAILAALPLWTADNGVGLDKK